MGADKSADFVLEIQKQSLVLLKNADKLLPLNKNKVKNVLVTGPLAKETNYAVCRYGPAGLTITSAFEGITNHYGKQVNLIMQRR